MSSVITEIPWQPTQISGCSLWLDAADPNGNGVIPVSNINLSTWVDKSGTGNNATPLTGTPRYVSSNVVFTGTEQYQTNLSYTSLTNMSYFALATIESANKCDIIGVKTTTAKGGYQVIIQNYNQLTTTYDGTLINSNTTNIPPNTRFLYTGTLATGATSFMFYNGTQVSSATAPTLAPNGTLTIGGYFDTGGFEQYIGNMNEILIYQGILNNVQRQQIEGYLAWKWGLQANLPLTHPYKTFAPLRNGIPLAIQPPLPYRVREQAPFLPTQISGCVTWLDPTDPTTVVRAGTTAVTQWNDKSGNGWSLTTQNGNPSYNANLINGRAGIDLTNSAAFISIADRTISANATVAMILVVKSGIATWGSFFTHGSRDTDIALERNSINGGTTLLHFQSANDSVNGDISYTVDQVALYIGTLSGGTSRFFARYGGGSATTATATNSSTISSGAQTIRIGRSDLGEACNSLIGEIVYYNKALSAQERQALEGYLAWKWGLQTSLPAGHPYASRALVPFSYPPGGVVATQVTWSPLSISGNRFWLDASDRATLTLSGNAVTQWRDKSANALHFNTTLGTPTYSRNAVTMPDVSLLTSASSISLTTNHYVFIVARLDSNSGLRMLLALPNINAYGDYSIRYVSGNLVNTQTQGGDTNDFAANYFVNGTFFPNFTYSTYSNIHIISGQAQKSGTSTVTLSGIYTFQNRYFIGNVYEVVMYTAPPSTIQRQRMEGYLAWKWGIQSNLPASHPFSRFPPST